MGGYYSYFQAADYGMKLRPELCALRLINILSCLSISAASAYGLKKFKIESLLRMYDTVGTRDERYEKHHT
jgi:hypothetical protein